MMDKHAKTFGTLSAKQAAIVSGALAAKIDKYKAPRKITGTAVFDACQKAELDQADVVTALSGESGDAAREVLSVITGKPVTKPEPQTASPRSAGSPIKTDQRVVVAVKPNPKREGSKSHARYAGLQVGMTLAEVHAATGYTTGDVNWDTNEKRNHIELAEPGTDAAKKAVAAFKRAAKKAA